MVIPLSTRGPLVLIADADAEALARVTRSLTAGGFRVVSASNGDAALERYVRERPDAVLVDATLDLDGFALCSRMRETRGGASVPIVMLTPIDDVDAAERSYACGATDFLTKPLSPLLCHRLRHLLRTRSAADDESPRSLARAQRLARLAQWRLDPEARTFCWAKGSGETFEGLEGEGIASEMLLRWVHPNDRARVADALSSMRSHHLEYRLALPSGEEVIVHQDADTEVDAVSGRVCLVGTAQDITMLRVAEQQVTRLAYYDELTALPNRSHACRFLQAAIATAKLRGQRIAILSLDLDLFRRVNDIRGHVAGNALLADFAGRLLRVTTSEVARLGRPQPMVARLGGDEFAVILCDVRSDDEVIGLFAQLATQLSEPHQVEGASVVVSFSAGIACYPESGGDVDELLMRADAAMHAAKDRGRGGYQIFAPEMQQKLERRIQVENRLREALASGRGLELHYQAKVDVPSLAVTGVEALLRWGAKDAFGPISPFELVSVAEETGLIVPLGDWVLRTACVRAQQWSVTSQPLRVAVNIASQQFGAADFAEKVRRVLAETGLPPELLELEITESVMMRDVEATGRMLERLKSVGVHVALDDFGTGYSSLSYLTRFPIDALKIDRSFVIEIAVASKTEAIIRAIVALSRSLGIQVVAEGVETEQQRAFLESLGPLTIQGWLFSKALAGEAVFEWIVGRHAALAA
jgi:diguanylate cyclase (GGDEF)-like protein